MKKIEAIIRPQSTKEVIAALEAAGYPGVTVSDVQGHGKQRGVTEQWRGQTFQVSLLPKIKIEIVAKDKDAEKLVQAIVKTTKTGAVGDGKIFVTDVADVVRIRTEERGEAAVS